MINNNKTCSYIIKIFLSFFWWIQNFIIIIYEEKTAHIHRQTERELLGTTTMMMMGEAYSSCCMCSSSGSIIGDRWLPIFSARWTSSEKKKTMQFFRSSRPVQHGSQAQTLVVYYIFIYIHSSLIPLLCNHNNTIKDNKIQINAGRCKYAFIRSSFQPHTPFRIMSKYKKIRVLSPYIFLCPKEEKWK